MAKVKRIMVHCTGEPANAKRTKHYYHCWFFKHLRWTHYGYHRVIYQDGSYSDLQPVPAGHKNFGYISDATRANGCKGANDDTLHVAYVGGLDATTKLPQDTRTAAQKETLIDTIKQWKELFGVSEIIGHRDWPGVKKNCPGFNAKKEYENV